MMISRSGKYAHCPPRVKPKQEVDQETLDEISARCRVTPLYEKGVYEYINRRHYSLQRNESLQCAWTEYKKNIETKVYAPFAFPNQRDIHFYNSSVRFLPSQTVMKRPTFRKSLKPGPGVDSRGQMPIPQEALMKRTTSKENKEKKKSISKAGETEKLVNTEKVEELEKAEQTETLEKAE